jgi:hypothetical protein
MVTPAGRDGGGGVGGAHPPDPPGGLRRLLRPGGPPPGSGGRGPDAAPPGGGLRRRPGVVTSASYACRPFGVRSGMPMGEALRLCPRATVVPVPRRACVERSRAVREPSGSWPRWCRPPPSTSSTWTSPAWSASSGTSPWRRRRSGSGPRCSRRRRSPSPWGEGRTAWWRSWRRAREAGGGPGHSPRGGGGLPPGVPAGGAPGVGPSLLEGLARRGLREVRDVVEAEEEWLIRWFGEGRGRWLHERCRGIDPSPVVAEEERKSISSERTFPRDVPAGSGGRRRPGAPSPPALPLRGRGPPEPGTPGPDRDGEAPGRRLHHPAGLPDPSPPPGIGPDPVRDRPGAPGRAPAEAQGRRPAPGGGGVEPVGRGPPPAAFPAGREDAREETERDRTLSRLGDELRARFGREALLPGRILEEPRTGKRTGSQRPRTAEGGR